MKVDLILTADWHLREDTPPCRTDDFEKAQWNKIRQIERLQIKHECGILHAGDLFHHWKPSPNLISTVILNMPQEFYTVAGQHDLPQHNMDLVEKSGLYTLVTAKVINWIREAGNFGQSVGYVFSFGEFLNIERRVGVWHHFVWNGKDKPWFDCNEVTAREVLKENPSFDLIVTGDYHRPFTYEYKGRLLVNCGCLTRQVADYHNHQPRVWLWNAKTNTVQPHFLEIEEDVINRDHIEMKATIDNRMEAFISRLDSEWEVGVSFESNLKRFLSKNKIRKSVVDLVYKSME